MGWLGNVGGLQQAVSILCMMAVTSLSAKTKDYTVNSEMFLWRKKKARILWWKKKKEEKEKSWEKIDHAQPAFEKAKNTLIADLKSRKPLDRCKLLKEIIGYFHPSDKFKISTRLNEKATNRVNKELDIANLIRA